MVDTNGEWKWSWLEGWLPDIMSENCNHSTSRFKRRRGRANMYHVICDFDRAEEDIKWKSVWKLKVPERVKYFIWMMMMHGVGYLQI
jgi:hypothetical protein